MYILIYSTFPERFIQLKLAHADLGRTFDKRSIGYMWQTRSFIEGARCCLQYGRNPFATSFSCDFTFLRLMLLGLTFGSLGILKLTFGSLRILNFTFVQLTIVTSLLCDLRSKLYFCATSKFTFVPLTIKTLLLCAWDLELHFPELRISLEIYLVILNTSYALSELRIPF